LKCISLKSRVMKLPHKEPDVYGHLQCRSQQCVNIPNAEYAEHYEPYRWQFDAWRVVCVEVQAATNAGATSTT
jgi:hypothetical protein